jgi:hypothetical protein
MSSSGSPPDVGVVLVHWKVLHLAIDALEAFPRCWRQLEFLLLRPGQRGLG